MNQVAFDALLGRIDAEIAEGPVPLRKIAASITVTREDIGPSLPRVEDLVRAALEEQVHSAALVENPCPPRPPEPPPAAPQRSLLARLLFRRTR